MRQEAATITENSKINFDFKHAKNTDEITIFDSYANCYESTINYRF